MKKAVIGMLVHVAVNRIAVECMTRKVMGCSYQDIVAKCYEDAGDAYILPKGVDMVLEEVLACAAGIPFMAIGFIQGRKLGMKNK